jgi:hypothetical protein
MATSADRSESDLPWVRPLAEPTEQRKRVEIARRIAREALAADRQAVETDARFAFKVTTGG